MFSRRVPVQLRRLVLAIVLSSTATSTVLVAGIGPSSAQAAPCDPPIANPIVCENSKPGNPSSDWNLPNFDAGDLSIQGYAAEFSVNKGETVQFKVSTPATDYHLDIYRMGFYQGNGARKITTVTPSVSLPQTQPACLTEAAVGLVDCGNWAASASWAVPSTAVSGIHFAKLVRADTGGASHIFFIVRDDAGNSPVLFQTSDTTWQAYNSYGGASLYRDFGFGLPAGRAFKVSYNRPLNTRSSISNLGPRSFLFNAEYPMVRWLEANGYNVSYFSGIDTDRRPSLLTTHRVLLSVGQDEYWSGSQRANVEAARDAGLHLAFLSGNEAFWKTRWENSIDGSGTAYRTLVSYKETHANAAIDPADPPTWTGTWRDPRFSPPADGGRPENGLTGQIFTVNGPQYNALVVPQAQGTLRLWRNTSVATLAPGTSATITAGCTCLLGHEWDSDLDNGSRPAGLVPMSETTENVPLRIQDYGSDYGPGTATHNLSLYRAASGALVFGAGTVNWSWGLDANHDIMGSTPSVIIQQATVNLLADMSVQPGSLQSGLVAASQTTDTTKPASTITSPGPGASVPNGTPVTVTGTATDSGGRVGAVEVSEDGGATWHRATGTSNWTYAWTPGAPGTATLRSRAVDDSGNIETPSAGVTVTITLRACPCSIWPDTAVPTVVANDDSSPVELGVKFRADNDGYVTGIRFYKASSNAAPHVGSLWSRTGQLLGTVAFNDETASGWQQANFGAPIAVTANTTYIASYHTTVGHYAADQHYFADAEDAWPLHALADGVDGGQGVFAYGSNSVFPGTSFNATNYWVDLVFNTSPVIPTPQPTATATQTPTPTPTSTTGPATATPSSTPTSVPPNCPCTIWSNTDAPIVPSNSDTSSIELGVKFRSDQAGFITGFRFYKGANNTGTHVGSLWTSTGTLLGNATVTSESATGWQQVNLPSPIAISASTTYVASYHAPNGGYAADQTYFSAGGQDRPPLHALANGVEGGQGVYAYSSGTVFPTSTFNSTNYWVDVVFNTTSPTATPTSTSTPTRTPTPGTPMATATATPTPLPSNCPCTIWTSAVQPASTSSGGPVELGVKVRSDQGGFISGIRFYKPSGETGTHTVNLWSSTGALLASATSSGETASGWQQANFASPVAINASTSYVASYHSNGTFGYNLNAFSAAGVDTPPLHALQSGVDGPNGLYMYGPTSAFPTNTYNGSNYWVDVVFSTTLPTATATATPTRTPTPGSPTATPTRTPTLPPVSCPCSIWSSSAVPAVPANADTNAVELGVKFRADRAGRITGVRFYKSTTNTGAHVANLWSSTGALLGSATFAGETASGWQQASFATPVPVTANTTYVASYHTNAGNYAADQTYFASSGVTNGPLQALATGVDGGNGVYVYGGASAFPINTFNATNYWVDVVFVSP